MRAPHLQWFHLPVVFQHLDGTAQVHWRSSFQSKLVPCCSWSCKSTRPCVPHHANARVCPLRSYMLAEAVKLGAEVTLQDKVELLLTEGGAGGPQKVTGGGTGLSWVRLPERSS